MSDLSQMRGNSPSLSGRNVTDRSSNPVTDRNVTDRSSNPVTDRDATDRYSSPVPSRNGKPKKTRLKFITKTTGIALIIAALLFGGWFWSQSSNGTNIDGSKYQALFLTNGQVYFGKLQTQSGGYMKLTDIYYLQAKTTDTSTDTSTLQDTSAAASDVQLIKLGSEIHGPSDEMIISKDQILFFENLKKDGKVAESIAKYQKQK